MNIIILSISLYLVYYDIKYKKVPNSINLLLLIIILITKIYFKQEVLISIFSGIVAFTTFLIIHLISRGNMGIGDCKFTGIIAIHLGFYYWLYSIIISSITALVVSLFLLFSKKIKRDTKIPFIPFLVFGLIIELILYQYHVL